MKPVLTLRAALPAALAAFALLSGPASAQQATSAPTTAMPEPNVTLTRADVERDLAAWRNSGAEREWNREESPDINSPQYIADYRKYMETVHAGSTSQPPSQPGSPRRW